MSEHKAELDVLDVLREVREERAAQDAKWGEQNHADGTGRPCDKVTADQQREACERAFREGWGSWSSILREEVAEAFAESDPSLLRAELVQVAAVAVAWVEAIDRRLNSTTPACGCPPDECHSAGSDGWYFGVSAAGGAS